MHGFEPDTAAKNRLSPPQWLGLCCLGVGSGALLWFDPVLFIRMVMVITMGAATGFLLLRAAAFTMTLQRPPRPVRRRADEALPTFALLCPLYREPESVPNLIGALGALDYPTDHLDILILLEADDHETPAAISDLAPHFKIITVPDGLPKTKPRALNYGLRATAADIIGVYDAEDRPEADQLKLVAGAFAAGGPDLACVQARLNYYNRDDTLVTRMFALEYALQFDWFLPGLTRLGLPLPLGGTSNFIRAEALRKARGWDAFNVTEDADLGMKLGALGYKMQAIDSTTFEEATDSPIRWIKQRSRWLKGYLQTWFVHTRTLPPWRDQIVLHFALGAVFLSAVMNPLTWVAFLAWSLFGWEQLDPVFKGGFGDFCLAIFLAGTSAHLWFTVASPLRRGWFDLTTSFLFIPIYWVLQSAAGYKALYEFILSPHYWDKTSHSEGAQKILPSDHA